MSERAEIARLRRALDNSHRENQRLRDKYEPKIVRLVGVAPAGTDRLLLLGDTADGRQITRIEPS